MSFDNFVFVTLYHWSEGTNGDETLFTSDGFKKIMGEIGKVEGQQYYKATTTSDIMEVCKILVHCFGYIIDSYGVFQTYSSVGVYFLLME